MSGPILELVATTRPDPTRRAELVDSVWHVDDALIDVPFEGAGHEGFAVTTDVVEIDDAGRLVRVIGIFGDLTPA